MDPVAFNINGLHIRWYGICVATAFLVGFWVVRIRARRKGGEVARFEQLVFWGLLGGILGARILYVLQYWRRFADQPAEIVRIDHGGLVFYGGLIGAFGAVFLVSSLKSLNKRFVADIFAPALVLAHAIGRIGCFLNGCCFGKPYDGPLAVQYPPGSPACYVQQKLDLISTQAMECLPVFPIQLLASAANLTVFVVLIVLEPHLKYKGQLFAVYVILYSAFRFGVEFGRGDYLVHYAGLTTAQIFCLILFPLAVAAFLGLREFGQRES